MKLQFDLSSEFNYYTVSESVLSEHWARSIELERQGYYHALKTLKPFGLLDSELIKDKQILDIGAGEAEISVALARTFQPRSVFAVDLIPKQIWASAYRHYKSPEVSRGQLVYVIGNALDLPFEDSCFDIVVCNLFYHHLPGVSKANFAQELFRVIKPGGLFVCREPNSLISWLPERGTSANEKPFPASVLRQYLQVSGFSEVEVFYYWTQFETYRLGWLSPSYIVRARVSAKDQSNDGGITLKRALRQTSIPGLWADPMCLERAEVVHQLITISQLIPSITN